MKQAHTRILLLFLAPFLLRAALTLWLPGEVDADGYSHMLIARKIAQRIADGDFRIQDLHGYWLPLNHFFWALLTLVFGSVYWVSRFVSVFAGAATCVLVWVTTKRLLDIWRWHGHLAHDSSRAGRPCHPASAMQTPNAAPPTTETALGKTQGAAASSTDAAHEQTGESARASTAAWCAWLLLVIAPWHLLYSALGMMEVPFSFCTALSVYLLMRSDRTNRLFVGSSTAMAAACLLRYEGWILGPTLWLIGVFQKRARPHMLILGGFVLAFPVIGWHWLNYNVTGNAFEYLAYQKQNLEGFYAIYPQCVGRGIENIVRHVLSLGVAASPALFVLGAVGLVLIPLTWRLHRNAVAAWVIVFISILFQITSYAAGRSETYVRYWVPMLWGTAVTGGFAVALLKERLERVHAFKTKRGVFAVRAVFCAALLGSIVPFAAPAFRLPNLAQNHYEIAHELQRLYLQGAISGKIHSDEPSVVIHSNIPYEKFVECFRMPRERVRALEFIREAGVDFIVWTDTDYGPARAAFPELKAAQSTDEFTLSLDPPGNEARRKAGWPTTFLFKVNPPK